MHLTRLLFSCFLGITLFVCAEPIATPLHPAEIKRSAPRPADFDAFWKQQLMDLSKVPMNAILTPGKGGEDTINHFMLTVDLARGERLRGQLALLDRTGKFPAMVIFQYAGVYGLPPGIVTRKAAEGWLVLNVCAHDLPLDQPKEFYQQQELCPLKNYVTIGNTGREESYFLRMFLAASRAIDYLASRPDWDGRTLVAIGTSQGGLQAIVAAALNPKVTGVIALVPAGCDTTAPLAGRAMSWPYWLKETNDQNRDAVTRTSTYFDALNFAPLVKCPTLVGFGLLDRTSTPEGISQLVALLRGHVEKVIMPDADHKGSGGTHEPFEKRSVIWLEALKAGKPYP
jgi:cephalosporin-C deacetylase-like acetyl esterase